MPGSFAPIMLQAINTCSIFGNPSSITFEWVSVNLLLILLGFAIAGAMYMIGNMLPRARSLISFVLKEEVTQLMLSLVIIVVLASLSVGACNFAASMSRSLTGTPLNQFQFADLYIGNLTFNTGLGLLSSLYSTSIQYYISGQVYTALGDVYINGLVSGLSSYASKLLSFGTFDVSFQPSTDLGQMFSIFGDALLGTFSPLVSVAIAFLLTQWLFIVFIQYTAFLVVLPAALLIRVVTASGAGSQGLRFTANAMIAFAIALYLVYPLTIAFNVYAVHWIYCTGTLATTGCNPSFGYLHSTYALPAINTNSFFAISPYTGTSGSIFGLTVPTIESFTSNIYGLTITNIIYSRIASTVNILGRVISYLYLPNQLESLALQTADFLFSSLVLFGLDLTITFAFAISIAKALTSGLEGDVKFWGSL